MPLLLAVALATAGYQATRSDAPKTEPPKIDAASLDRYIYPLAPVVAAPTVVVDASAAPDTKAWADTSATLMRVWYPTVRSLLATNGARIPKELKLTMKPNIGPPAYCSGDEITVKAEWVRDHPDDLGIVIHEMAHAIQSYPNAKTTPGWLVEGIADYIRWWRYEPGPPHTKINPDKSNYTDAYRTTAYWLAWVEQKYDRRLVPMLDAAMRKREDPLPVFEKLTKKDADTLWKEFVATKP